MLALTAKAGEELGFTPEVSLAGPAGTHIAPDVAAQMLAVLREWLSSVLPHAQDTAADIAVTAGRELTLTVTDNGSEPPASGTGLAETAARARAMGGRCTAQPRTPRGTTLQWQVPLTDGPAR